MKKIFTVVLLPVLILVQSCTKDSKESTTINTNESFTAFGHFYGFCVGESCIEIFRVTQNSLYEETNDKYPNFNQPVGGNFDKKPDTTYQLVKDFESQIPAQLLLEPSGIIGAPDATDGGGIYVEVYKTGMHKYWYIDKMKFNIPAYLHTFIDEAEANITLINQ